MWQMLAQDQLCRMSPRTCACLAHGGTVKEAASECMLVRGRRPPLQFLRDWKLAWGLRKRCTSVSCSGTFYWTCTTYFMPTKYSLVDFFRIKLAVQSYHLNTAKLGAESIFLIYICCQQSQVSKVLQKYLFKNWAKSTIINNVQPGSIFLYPSDSVDQTSKGSTTTPGIAFTASRVSPS